MSIQAIISQETNSQKTDVIEWLRKHGSITPMQALTELGVFRLAARTKDLEIEGFVFERELIPVRARNGRIARVMRYDNPVKL